MQNDDPTSAYNASDGQSVQLQDGAGGDQEISRVAHDTTARRDAATLNALPVEQRSTASQLDRHYERDTRDEQANRTDYEDRGRDNSKYDNIIFHQTEIMITKCDHIACNGERQSMILQKGAVTIL